MSFETQKIKFTNLEINDNINDLQFTATNNIELSTTTGLIYAPNENINLDGNNITNVGSVSSISGTDLTIEGLGNGGILFKAPSTQAVATMELTNTGIMTNAIIPTCGTSATVATEILNYNNFTSQTSFTPVLTGSSGGTAIYTSQIGSYTRIGNIVWFQASITTSSLTTMTGTDDIRLSIPLPINYTTLNLPQGICITSFIGVNQQATDLTLIVGGSGSASIGASVQYSNLYYKLSNASSGLISIKYNMVANAFTIRYSGCYYLF